jgi:hypothetical protein
MTMGVVQLFPIFGQVISIFKSVELLYIYKKLKINYMNIGMIIEK